jgi:hypothetical protein
MIGKQRDDRSMTEMADAAFSAAAEQVLIRARQTGTDIVLWRDDRVVWISPDEFQRELEEIAETDRKPQ